MVFGIGELRKSVLLQERMRGVLEGGDRLRSAVTAALAACHVLAAIGLLLDLNGASMQKLLLLLLLAVGLSPPAGPAAAGPTSGTGSSSSSSSSVAIHDPADVVLHRRVDAVASLALARLVL